MFKMNCAKDLHRKGELFKVEQMELLASNIETKNKDLAKAFITEGFFGCDGFAMMAQSPKAVDSEGWVLWNEDTQKPIFVLDSEEE